MRAERPPPQLPTWGVGHGFGSRAPAGGPTPRLPAAGPRGEPPPPGPPLQAGHALRPGPRWSGLGFVVKIPTHQGWVTDSIGAFLRWTPPLGGEGRALELARSQPAGLSSTRTRSPKKTQPFLGRKHMQKLPAWKYTEMLYWINPKPSLFFYPPVAPKAPKGPPTPPPTDGSDGPGCQCVLVLECEKQPASCGRNPWRG